MEKDANKVAANNNYSAFDKSGNEFPDLNAASTFRDFNSGLDNRDVNSGLDGGDVSSGLNNA